MHLQMRVGPQRPLQSRGDVDRLALEVLVGPRVDPLGDLLVMQVAAELQLGPHVVVHRRGIRADDRVEGRVGVHLLGDRAGRRPGEARIQPPDREPLVPEQLAEEAPVLDPQLRLLDIALRHAGQARHRRHHLGPLVRAQPRPARQRPRVVAGGIRARLGDHLIKRASGVLAVIVSDGGIQREVCRVRPVVALSLEVDRGQVEHGRDEDDPVEVHAVAGLQVIGQRRCAQRAVGLTGQELRRHPPAVARGPQPDHLGDALEVALVAVIGPGLAALDRP